MKASELLEQFLERANDRYKGHQGNPDRFIWISAKQRIFLIDLIQKSDPENPCYPSNLGVDSVKGFHVLLSPTTSKGACQVKFRKILN